MIQTEAAANLKRVWVGGDWQADPKALLRQASEVKTVWVPYGE
jgi:aldehyde dehydrogenase (NAD+)